MENEGGKDRSRDCVMVWGNGVMNCLLMYINDGGWMDERVGGSYENMIKYGWVTTKEAT